MADTIITNTPDRTTSDSGALGAVIALIVLAVVVIGGIYLYRHGGVGVPNTGGGTNINVTLPSGSSGGGNGGATSGGGGSTGGSGATQ